MKFLAFLLLLPTLWGQPQRIVSTAPSVTELLYALGLGSRVAGVTTFCNYPPEAKQKPKIGGYTDPNIETIASLRPDLVLVQSNPVRLAERLRVMKLNVVEIDQSNLAALYQSFRQVGEATGAREAAAALEQKIKADLAQIQARADKLPRVPMTFVVGRNPGSLQGLMVAGRASYLNEVIALAGGKNIFADAVASYPAISLEEMISRNPQLIVDMGDMSDTVVVTEEKKRSVAALWNAAPTIAAVKQRRVHPVAADYFVVPGPRVVEAARAFFALLHPGKAVIAARDLGFAFGLANVSFEMPQQGLVAVAGPNGAGKSTLLGILAGLRAPYRGSVTLEAREISRWPRRDLARRVAYLAQTMRFEFPFRTEELVLMGRAPFAQGWFETSTDHALALAAMEATETIALRDRDVRTLSGGERQRVLLAAALVQQPGVLLLDEPATHLDLRHQLDLYRLLRREACEKLVIAVTHDLNLALQFADRILVLHDGRLAADGIPREVLTPDLIWQVFGVHAHASGPVLHYELDTR